MRTSPSADARLRLLAPLGHGGMSDVWLGSLRGPAGFEKLVAVKQLRFVQSEGGFDRGQAFLREARLAARLNHPNVVQTFEILAQGGDYRIVMEFLEGQPLNRIMRKIQREIPLQELIRVLVDVLAGLHHAHELTDPQGNPLGVVHRDVSPHNVFVSYEGGVKLLDFGIAQLGRGEASDDDLVKGKLAYMAPEQAAGGAIDRRADVFAVGVILFEILAGRPMWDQTPDPTLYGELLAGRIPSIDAAAPSAPAPLRKICARALAKDPARRFPTALAMRQALDDWLGSMRPNPMALGDRLTAAFASDRERIKAIVAHSLAVHDDDNTDDTDLYAPTPAAARPRPPALLLPDPDPPRTAWRWLVPLTGALSAAAMTGVVAVALAIAGGAAYLSRDDLAVWFGAAPVPGVPVAGDLGAAAGCPPVGRRTPVELSGNVDADATLDCTRTYLLGGVVRVLPGATLTIGAGTVLVGKGDAVLVIEPGARIAAEGSAEAPIVMTSEGPEASWGGLVLLGRAPTNLPDARFKGLRPEGDAFGGDRDDDDSGVLRYVRIERGGKVLAPNNETNGVSFAGVGSGTRVDHVQVRGGDDDCFEWFGGTVDASHLVCVDPGDDGLDIEFGYRGELRNVVILDRIGGGADRNAVEIESDPPGTRDAAPRTAPVVSSLTACSTRPGPGYGLLVRRGAIGTISGVWASGYAALLDVRDRGGVVVRDVVAGAGTPFGPQEQAGLDDRSEQADDDGGLDEVGLIQGSRAGQACAVPPLDEAGGLSAADRWDAGWVRWD